MSASPSSSRSIRILMDAHVHFYPSYDLQTFLLAALDHLPRYAPTDQRVLCLAERTGHTFFQSLAQDEIPLPSDRWRIVAWDPEGAVKIRHRPTHRDLWIIAGRQYTTRENIEVCSLFSDAPVPDHMTARDTVRAIREEAGGLPALDWAFGKWLFARGKLVRRLLETNPPATLPLIDTAMRPPAPPHPPPPPPPPRRPRHHHRPPPHLPDLSPLCPPHPPRHPRHPPPRPRPPPRRCPPPRRPFPPVTRPPHPRARERSSPSPCPFLPLRHLL